MSQGTKIYCQNKLLNVKFEFENLNENFLIQTVFTILVDSDPDCANKCYGLYSISCFGEEVGTTRYSTL